MKDLISTTPLWQNHLVTDERTKMTKSASPAQINLHASLTKDILASGGSPDEFSTAENFAYKSIADASAEITRMISAVKALKKAAPAAREAVEPVTEFHVHPGIYTVERDGGRRTFRVEVQPSDAKFAPGQVIISHLAGPDNDNDYVGFGFVVGSKVRAWKRFADSNELLGFAETLMANPEAALVSKHCARCGRTLTTPESIRSGFGPECARKGLR